MKYTVEEVRAQANYEGRASGEPKTEAMLTSYADLLERIKADEEAPQGESHE